MITFSLILSIDYFSPVICFVYFLPTLLFDFAFHQVLSPRFHFPWLMASEVIIQVDIQGCCRTAMRSRSRSPLSAASPESKDTLVGSVSGFLFVTQIFYFVFPVFTTFFLFINKKIINIYFQPWGRQWRIAVKPATLIFDLSTI